MRRLQDAANLLQKLDPGRPVEVPDCTAQKQNQKMLLAVPVRGDFQQPVQILPFKAEDADAIDVSEFALAHDQRGARYFHRVIKSALAARERFEYPPGFFPATAAEFRHRDRTWQALHNLGRVPAQQALIRAGQTTLWKMADHFKQRRAHVV